MSTKEEVRKQDATQVEDDDEPDEWDKRIFSTGCADENAKMTDCYFEKKDWRACTEEAAGRAFIARPVTRPVTRFSYSDSASPAKPASDSANGNSTPASTPTAGDSTPASTPETAPAEAKPAQTPATEGSPAQPANAPVKKPVPVRRPTPVRKAVPFKKPLPAKKPAATSPPKAEPRSQQPAALDNAERVTDAVQASHIALNNPFLSSDPPAEIRAPKTSLKNTYEAKTVTFSHPKEHATKNDIDVPWDASFHGISTRPVTAVQFKVLMRPIDEEDIEVKPDGIIYLPEIKYRRRLNEAFGPMGWGMIPKSDPIINGPMVTREYALIVDGRFVSQAQGENHFYNEEGIPSAVEGCKSNALMRCCKDLGIASDLWDPRFIRYFKKEKMEEVWVEHQVTKKKRTLWFKKGQVEVAYPFKRT
ncbi:unnamed protein product [Clonostachys rosea]|uniref:Mitochondrial genome maintenance protein MGM101 n=1 Tax=Bionectria ochroleuca TaxID=29856 RepID=A0ABY6UFE3_BIOOC|nr:unnamed protein product [Clonostachys rosea]